MRSVILATSVITSCLLLACGGETAPPPKQANAVKPAPSTGVRTSTDPSGGSHSTGPTYDEALAEPEDVMALKGERELTNQELSAPMRNPTFITSCNAPDSMSITVKLAIRDGRVLGASVLTSPDDATVAECIDTAVRALTWPASKHRDSFVTKF